MVKPDETEPAAENGQWGTWEELLLACAVNRYGTKSWDSVAVEIRKRSSALITLTPHNCKAKYLDLKRRYRSVTDAGAAADDVPWLDELRKVRVAELKRELERYDLSIVSLQMKVKSLTEERGSVEEKSDLEKCEDIDKNDEHKPEIASPESADDAVKLESGEDNQSVNESNENLHTGEVKLENETNPIRTEEGNPEPGSSSPVRENSCNGSSDSKPVLEALKVEPVGEVSSETAEVSGEGTKENSDVQSSASKSSKERSDVVHCGIRKGDEGEGEDDQKGNLAVEVNSQPLVDILQLVRSHKLGSVFERRLESQEKLKYKNLIRQHINLKILQTRLEEGYYSDGNDKFFRDLLLLVNNAIVFFSKKSPESVAAIELRQLISMEMAKTKRNKPTDSSAEKQLSTTPPVTLPLKRAPEPSDSLLLKPKVAGPMIVCRKRSSFAAKASASTSASASGADRKKEQQKPALAEEKPVLDLKQPDKSLDEHRITKKRTRNAFPSVTEKKGKSVRADASPNKTSDTVSNQTQAKGLSPGEHSETRNDKKKKNPIEADRKKQGATNLLNRMKRSSISNNGASLDSLDKFKGSPDDDSENDIRGEQIKKGSNKGDGRKDHQVPVPVPVPKRSLGGRQMKDQDSPTKRSVGRPPKRAAAPVPMSSVAVTGKRSREVGDGEAVASKQPKKRPRK